MKKIDEKIMVKEFNIIFAAAGQKLGAKISSVNKSFTEHLSQNRNEIESNELTIDEFKTAFQTLKKTKLLDLTM